MGTSYNSNIVTDGLVLCLDAANPRSYSGAGSTWSDLSGRGNNATLENSPLFSSDNAGGIVFDGSDDYGSVSCSQFQSGNNPFSMEAFFKWSGNGTSYNNMIFAFGYDIGPHKVPLIMVYSNTFRFEFGSASGAVSSSIQANTWYHGVATYDLSYNKIYLNGDLKNTVSYTSANVVLSGSNGTNAGIGCLFSQYGNINVVGYPRRYGTFNGSIYSIRYYNRALSAQEIRQNYNATRGRYGN